MVTGKKKNIFLIIFILTFPFTHSNADNTARVYLSNTDEERYYLGELEITPGENSIGFSFDLHEESFGDYFLSMRPFRCLEKSGRMLCYLPYPYEKPDEFNESDMRAVEYDFLFIQRESKDYGIDPWNGLYYKLTQEGNSFRGVAYAVDLNILASPPEDGVIFPLSDTDLHSLEAHEVWLPKLEILGFTE